VTCERPKKKTLLNVIFKRNSLKSDNASGIIVPKKKRGTSAGPMFVVQSAQTRASGVPRRSYFPLPKNVEKMMKDPAVIRGLVEGKARSSKSSESLEQQNMRFSAGSNIGQYKSGGVIDPSKANLAIRLAEAMPDYKIQIDPSGDMTVTRRRKEEQILNKDSIKKIILQKAQKAQQNVRKQSQNQSSQASGEARNKKTLGYSRESLNKILESRSMSSSHGSNS
ncbi:hypothetical protein EGW08_012312, partial [Elysia chlorotica]